MPITFRCECSKKMRAPDHLAGKRVRCPVCGIAMRIPATPDAPADADAVAGMGPPAAPRPRPASAPAPRPRPAPAPEPADDPEAPYGLAGESSGQYDLAPAPRARDYEDHEPALPRGRATAAVAAAASGAADPGSSPREYLYLVLALALIPLAFSLLSKDEGNFKDRLEQTMKKASPEVVAQVEKVVSTEGHGTLDDLLGALPGGRLDGAHLARNTIDHWLYAVFASCAFWALIMFLFPAESRNPAHMFFIGVFTGTIGIVLLLAAQFLAGATQGVWLRSRSAPVLVIFYLAKFIGFSYASANDPDSNLLLSFVGFTCGVGLCEELAKALPLLVHFGKGPRLGWRGACLWGLASGVGFGVSEGIMYSANYYNGISPAGIYVVRYVSCVALHAVWSASVGITLWRRQRTIQGDLDWTNYALAVVQILAVPMILHGLYDTLLKKDMEVYALLIGAASFAWFAWQVEAARGTDTAAGLKRLQAA